MSSPTHPNTRILVWDAPVRVFHWLMVLCLATAWITADTDSDRWRLLHVTAGCTMAGLVAFRVLWGFVGTRHARFVNFVRGPKAALRYVRGLLGGRPEHHTGHNPAGALAIVGLLALVAAVTSAGLVTWYEAGPEWTEDLHEALAEALLVLVGLHVAGALASSWAHRENLIGAMFSGRKLGAPDEALRRAWHGVAALLLVAVLVFWWRQWQAPIVGAAASQRAEGGAAAADKPARPDKGRGGRDKRGDER